MSPGEAPPLDERRIFEVFARHGVEYVLVGGLGARLHGATRFTSDFDACPAWDRENLARLAAALNELGARLRDFPAELPFPPLTAEGLRRQLVGTWRTDAGDLDTLIGIPSGVPNQEHQYEALRSRAAEREIAGCTVYVADLADIIASKEAAARAKDQEALPELRALQADAFSQQTSAVPADEVRSIPLEEGPEPPSTPNSDD